MVYCCERHASWDNPERRFDVDSRGTMDISKENDFLS